MPPRLELLSRSAQVISRPSYQPIAPFLYPFLGQQRAASILSQLSDTPGAYNKRIRRGRGPASGKGKTAGRGQKGQKAHGKVPTGFNGGQTPESVRHPEKGFDNVFSIEFSPINLDRIQYWINQGRLDPTQPITLKELNDSRCTHGIKPGGVKLLARGKEELTTPIHLVVSRASAEAINAVEKLGGSVTTRYYTGFAVKKILAGQMDPINSLQSRIRFAPETEEGAEAVDGDLMMERSKYHYRLPDPASRKAIEYYRDSAHRGYLSHLVGEGQGPSLYFRTPGAMSGKAKTAEAKGPVKQKPKTSENRLW